MKLLYIIRNILLAVSVVFLSLFNLVSCVNNNTESTESVNVVVFTDALGRKVSVPQNPQKTAVLLGSFADIWVLAGGELCAAPMDAWEDFGLELPDAVNIGGAHSPGLELLLSAEPDLVIASASTASHVEMKETLERMGIPVVFFDVDNFDDYLSMLDRCTDITGRKDLYIQNGLQVQEEIERIKKQFENAPIPEEERRVLLLRASSATVKAKGSHGTILGEMLWDMGCVNIADNNGTLLDNLGTEAILAEEPYHIFIVTMGNSPGAAEKSIENLLKENSALGSLSAVKENRVHFMDKTLFNLKPNERWAEAYKILYEILTAE